MSEIGYKKPPKHTQWKKGQSGNPGGRAKGQRNLKTDLLAEMRELIQISEGRIPRRISKRRALLKAMVARAMAGDARATAEILNLYLRLLEGEDEKPAANPQPLSQSDQAILDAYLVRHGAQKGSSNGQ